MEVEVLGKSPAWQDAGGACSGYLVRDGDHRLLIDCGNGVFSKLRSRIDYTEIDTVLISHVHADHVLDLVPFAYGLTLPEGERPRPELLVPPGATEALGRLTASWGSDGLIERAFAVTEYERDALLRIGELDVQLHQVPHFTLTHAIALTSGDGRTIVYGADCRGGPELERAASGASTLIAEATLGAPEPDSIPESERGHMSAADAAEVAARAGVGELVLTHFSDVGDPRLRLDQARAAFTGSVRLAAEGMLIDGRPQGA